MWTIQDNGNAITWPDAEQYCKNLTLAGLSGWELPTIGELEKLYDPQTLKRIQNPKTVPTDRVLPVEFDEGRLGFRVELLPSTSVGGTHDPVDLSANNRALCVRRSGK